MHADLLDCAVKLACFQMDGTPPTQVDLRRAMSTTYYAVFHFVLEQCADILTCDPGGQILGRAWRQIYRSIRHSDVRKACNEAAVEANGFPPEIQTFAALYPDLRRIREEADYGPTGDRNFNTNHVMAKISEADFAIQQFGKAPQIHRRSFAILVAVKKGF